MLGAPLQAQGSRRLRCLAVAVLLIVRIHRGSGAGELSASFSFRRRRQPSVVRRQLALTYASFGTSAGAAKMTSWRFMGRARGALCMRVSEATIWRMSKMEIGKQLRNRFISHSVNEPKEALVKRLHDAMTRENLPSTRPLGTVHYQNNLGDVKEAALPAHIVAQAQAMAEPVARALREPLAKALRQHLDEQKLQESQREEQQQQQQQRQQQRGPPGVSASVLCAVAAATAAAARAAAAAADAAGAAASSAAAAISDVSASVQVMPGIEFAASGFSGDASARLSASRAVNTTPLDAAGRAEAAKAQVGSKHADQTTVKGESGWAGGIDGVSAQHDALDSASRGLGELQAAWEAAVRADAAVQFDPERFLGVLSAVYAGRSSRGVAAALQKELAAKRPLVKTLDETPFPLDDKARRHLPVDTRDVYVMRFDGGSRQNPGISGCGAVIYFPHDKARRSVELEDDVPLPTGAELWSGGTWISQSGTSNEAEYSALVVGLKQALEFGIKDIMVEGDSLLVVEQMRGNYRVRSQKLNIMHRYAASLSGQFRWVEFRHIPRAENGRADELANLAMDARPPR